MATRTNKVNVRQSAGAGETETAGTDRIEDYTPQRVAEFLLNNAVGPDDYAAAVEEVRKLGIDPATIPHVPPEA